jgi:serine/threonine protein kinase
MANPALSSSSPDLTAVASDRIAGGGEHYDIIDTLAHGSTADLLLAVRRGAMEVDSLVVLKRLRWSGTREEKRDTDIFLQEARVSVRLRHANIVHTFACGEDEGVPFLAMEYLEGESLREVMRESATRDMRLKPALAVHVACEALKGLHYAHTLRDYEGRPLAFVHRDVSPHNIFIGYDGTVKLIDFGIAKTTLAIDKTAHGIIKGKTAYLSPEQALGHTLDPRSDIFSLGITLWEMLSMQRLMVGNSAFDTMLRILNMDNPRLSEVTSGIAPALEDVVATSLARDRASRFGSAEEMRRALRDRACLDSARAGTEDLADAMDFLFRDARAQKQSRIHAKMTSLPRVTRSAIVPSPPLRRVLERPSLLTSEELSVRFVGTQSYAPSHFPSRSSSSSTPPPPPSNESGERLSLPRRTSDEVLEGELETSVRPQSVGGWPGVSSVRALAKESTHANPAPAPKAITSIPRQAHPTQSGERAARPRVWPAWVVADLALVAALAVAIWHEPTRARIASTDFWRDIATSFVGEAKRAADDVFSLLR